MLAISSRTRAHRVSNWRSRRGIQPIEQTLRDVLLLAQDGAAGRFRRVPGEHGFNAHGADQIEGLLERHSVALQARDAIGNAAGLRRARIVEILTAAADQHADDDIVLRARQILA